MKNFRIRANVEIEESEQTALTNPVIGEDGRFVMTISEEDATSIDICENAVLRTCHPAIRDAIRRHLTEISKKKPML